MSEFIINGIFWVLALYGLIEIIKTILLCFTHTDLSTEGIYVIVTVKNEEERIEGFIRSFLSRLLYQKERVSTNIILAGLDSNDRTEEILLKLKHEYKNIKFTNWEECKEIIDKIENSWFVDKLCKLWYKLNINFLKSSQISLGFLHK